MDSVQTMIDQHERTSSLPFSCLGMCVCLREWDGRQSELSLCLNEDFLSFSLWGVFPEKGLPSPGGRTSCYRELPGTNTHARVLASPPPSLTSGQCIYFWSWTAKSIFEIWDISEFSNKSKEISRTQLYTLLTQRRSKTRRSRSSFEKKQNQTGFHIPLLSWSCCARACVFVVEESFSWTSNSSLCCTSESF